MSNIYRFSTPAVSHFQLPHALDKWLNSIKLEEIRLLLLVHSEAERMSRSDITLSTETICTRTGIHATNIKKVREALVDYGLLLLRQEGRTFTYIVADPKTNTAITDRFSLETVDFNALSADVLHKYILNIIPDARFTSHGVEGRCPLAKHEDSNASFVMNVNSGTWRCRGCGKSGNLVGLERQLSENSVGVVINPTEAHRRVKDRLRHIGAVSRTTGKLGPIADVVYSYSDGLGDIIFEVVRPKGQKTGMYQRRPHPQHAGRYINNTQGCRDVLYNLPDVIEAYTVMVVEGERDAETVSKLCLKDAIGDPIAVTTCRNGANGWKAEHSETLKGKRVILCGDTDAAGVQHMRDVQASLEALGITCTRIDLPSEFRDISDYLESHSLHITNSLQTFTELVGDEWLQPFVSDLQEI